MIKIDEINKIEDIKNASEYIMRVVTSNNKTIKENLKEIESFNDSKYSSIHFNIIRTKKINELEEQNHMLNCYNLHYIDMFEELKLKLEILKDEQIEK